MDSVTNFVPEETTFVLCLTPLPFHTRINACMLARSGFIAVQSIRLKKWGQARQQAGKGFS